MEIKRRMTIYVESVPMHMRCICESDVIHINDFQ